MLNSLGTVSLGFDLSQRKINEVLITTVVKVTQKVSLHSKVAVVESAFHRSFTSSSKVSFHSWSTRVKHTYCVSIVCPLHPEHLLQIVRKPLKS